MARPQTEAVPGLLSPTAKAGSRLSQYLAQIVAWTVGSGVVAGVRANVNVVTSREVSHMDSSVGAVTFRADQVTLSARVDGLEYFLRA